VESDQKSSDLSIAARTGQNLAHDSACLVTRERLAVIGYAMESVGDHQRIQA